MQDKHLSAFGVILDFGICVTLQRQTAVRMSCVMWELVKQVNDANVQFLRYAIDKPVSLCYSAYLSLCFCFSASVLDIKVMGCLPVEACNMTTYVEFLANKTLYTMKTTCCDEDFCNSASVVQLSLAPLLLTVLLIAQMMGVF